MASERVPLNIENRKPLAMAEGMRYLGGIDIKDIMGIKPSARYQGIRGISRLRSLYVEANPTSPSSRLKGRQQMTRLVKFATTAGGGSP